MKLLYLLGRLLCRIDIHDFRYCKPPNYERFHMLCSRCRDERYADPYGLASEPEHLQHLKQDRSG